MPAQRSSLLAYLQLARAANVFTAAADIVLGCMLTGQQTPPDWRFWTLCIASMSLYLAGMVFNDVFDHEVDLVERPSRPIPSGRVSQTAAVVFGTVLIIIGNVAALVVGPQSGVVAVMLTAAIFAYDGLLKSTVVGPLSMGVCRFLNVMLGASLLAGADSPSLTAVWAMPQLQVAAGLGVYITGVTWFSRQEASVSNRPQLMGAAIILNIGLLLLIAFALLYGSDTAMAGRAYRPLATALLIGAVGVSINRNALNAILDPQPARVRTAIKIMILSVIMLDASLVWLVQPNMIYAMALALLILPSLALARFLAVT